MALKNIIGHVYGDLTVMNFSHTDSKHSYWWCNCSCGNGALVRSNNLKTGNTSNCGNNSHRLGNGLVDISGQTFNRLTAIELNRSIKWKGERTFWDCLCVCGEITTVESGNLKSGHTKSCGCLLKETITTHGCCAKDRRLYGIWRGMIDRCENKKSTSYEHYGLMGIKVCEEWHDVTAFFDWAFKNEYVAPLTIERINVHKGYEPSNCTWIPLFKQNRNKTTFTLGEENVKNIRELLSEGRTPAFIARMYGCAYTTIIAIKNYETYKEL